MHPRHEDFCVGHRIPNRTSAIFEQILEGYPDLVWEPIQQGIENAAWLTGACSPFADQNENISRIRPRMVRAIVLPMERFRNVPEHAKLTH